MRSRLLLSLTAWTVVSLTACGGKATPAATVRATVSPSTQPPSSVPASSVPASSVPAADVLTGTWVTGKLTHDTTVALWKGGGGSPKGGELFWAGTLPDPVNGGRPSGVGAKGDFVVELKLHAPSIIQFNSLDGGPFTVGWAGTYEISGTTVRLSDKESNCVDTYQFSVQGDTLQLRLTAANGCGFDNLDPPANAVFSHSYTRGT